MRRARPLLALAAVAALAVGGIAIAQAAPGDLTLQCPAVPNPVAGQTITCTYVAESTTVPPSTTPPPVTTTASPTLPTTTTQPPAGLKGWQITATNVGLAPKGLSCSTLPAYTGSLKPARGSRISTVRITGPLDLSNGDIVVEHSCIRPTSTGYHNAFLVTTTTCAASCTATTVGGVVIRDSEIDASALSASAIRGSCAFLGVGTLQRNYMHHMGSGICFFEAGKVHSALAENNYVTGLRSYGDSHNEAATVRDFVKDATNSRTVKFVGNRLVADSGNTTAGLFVQPTWIDIHNLEVRGNLIEGQGYNLYVEHGISNGRYGNIRAIDNRMNPYGGWGPATTDTTAGPGWAEWRDNHRYDATKPDAKGAVVNP